MPDILFKAIFILGIVIETAIRAPIRKKTVKNEIVDRRITRAERINLSLLFLWMFFVPMIYIFTPWLNFANYSVPLWSRWIGVAIFAAGIFVFYRSQVELGINWSASLEMRKEHSLISNGIYRFIRHPMYASQFLFAIGQIFLLPNWLAGPTDLIFFIIFYASRVRKEEQMMLDTFGEEYRQYMARTGRVLPKLF